MKIDPTNQAAKQHLQTRQSKAPARTSHTLVPVSQRAINTEEDLLAAEKRLEEGYQALMAEAKLLRLEIEAVHKLGGIQVDDDNILTNLNSISEGRVNEAVPMVQPLSARETARLIKETPNQCEELLMEDFETIVRWATEKDPPLKKDAIRERLVKRKVLLEAALPDSMQKHSVAALAHIEREHFQKKYVNSETMLGDRVADIPKRNFFVSEDNYAWDMEELAQAIKSNEGVMRNPLSKQMFTESDIRMILNHPLGKPLKPLQQAQSKLKKGVRPATIAWIEKLGRIMLEDQSVDTLPSRKAMEEFQAYIATLPEPEQKTINQLKIAAKDRHTGQPFDYTVGESVKDAVANVTCFHKVYSYLPAKNGRKNC
jgi:hypothetical protein